jgi:DNA-binding MarR family transcriptional regulator/GNAT superfamily N-acetyltransferase
MDEQIAAFRRFNRMYTRYIGTLDEGLLNTEYSLAEARVLYELATRPEPRAKEIAEGLGIDPGYLSRILGRFESTRLLKRRVSTEDSRRADLGLTKRGTLAFEKLNGLSDRQARTILDRLLRADRTRLIGAMKAIEAILVKEDPNPAPYVLRPHRPGDMGWVVYREGAIYAAEYGFDDTFEALVARIVADFLSNFDARRERCWMADMDGESVGHIFLVKHPEDPDTAKLRLLLVESSARGKGLGQALVNECVRFARSAGYRKITLWTQSILISAHRIYQSAGFRLVREERHRSFGKDLMGQTWELELGSSGDRIDAGGVVPDN